MKFRKRPVEIDAIQWRGVADALPDWAMGRISFGEGGNLYVATLEGVMRAEVGDWIIRGIKGEVYPCAPDIFARTYEATADEGRRALAAAARDNDLPAWKRRHA